MKVLMLTPRVDREHPIFGHLQAVIKELGSKVDSLQVITFNEQRNRQENGINIYGTGRGSKKSRFIEAHRLTARLTRRSDIIFTYMYPGELPLIAAPYAKLFRKPMVMYRNHGHVDKKSRISHCFANRILTASPEGCRINSNKVKVIGHHIDIDEFKPLGNKRKDIVSVGRIDRAKRQDKILKVMNILINEFSIDAKIDFVGKVLDENFYNKLKKYVRKYNLEDNVNFIGYINHVDMPQILNDYRVFVDASTTGSLDTVTLEAMACGTPVVTRSRALYNIFSSNLRDHCYYDSTSLAANQVRDILNGRCTRCLYGLDDLGGEARQIVRESHSLRGHVANIIKAMEEVV